MRTSSNYEFTTISHLINGTTCLVIITLDASDNKSVCLQESLNKSSLIMQNYCNQKLPNSQ